MEFTEWLEQQLEEKRWSGAELARRAKISQAIVSLVLNGQRQPGPDFCEAVAGAFKIPSDVVFRRAGLLPPEPVNDEGRQELFHLYEMLDQSNREDTIDYARMKLQKQERESKGEKHKKVA